MKFGSDAKREVYRLCRQAERDAGLTEVKLLVGYSFLSPMRKRFVTNYINERSGKVKPKSDASTRSQRIAALQGQLITIKHMAVQARDALYHERESDKSSRTIHNDAVAMKLADFAIRTQELTSLVDSLQRYFRNYATGKQNLRRSSDQQQEG